MRGSSLLFRATTLCVVVLTSFAMFAVIAPPALAVDGELDPTFDADGRALAAYGSFGTQGAAVALQPDGRIVSVGHTMAGPSDEMWYLTRHLPSGALDGSFANCAMGMTCYNISGGTDRALGVTVHPTGYIVAAGYFTVGGANQGAYLLGVNPGGGLSWGFPVDLSAGVDRFTSVAAQPDGKLIVAGYSEVSGNDRALVARIFNGGGWDPSFSGGLMMLDITPADERFSSVAVQPDGRIVAAGMLADNQILVARYQPNGAADHSLGGSGWVTVPMPPPIVKAGATALLVEPSGNIVIAGTANNGIDDDIFVARLLPNGVPDPSFGTGGIVTTSITVDDRATGIARQPWNGRIVVSGSSGAGLATEFAMARYLTDGTPDTSFGKNGVVLTDFAGGDDAAAGLVIQSDHRIVASGRASTPSGAQLALARYVPDTTPPDTTITSGPTGTVATDVAEFTFISTEPGSFECRLDGGGWEACDSPRAYGGLTDGGHLYEVRAVDLAGNADPSPAARSWSVDTTPPETTIDSGPTGIVNSAVATFHFSANESASFECRLDSEPWLSCAPPYQVTAGEGPHGFDVRATDSVGNLEPDPAHADWTVDVTAPTATIVDGPDKYTRNGWASIEMSGDDGTGIGIDHFECSLDAEPWATCPSPHVVLGLFEGVHGIEVRAVDGFGQIGPPAGMKWVVDTLTPYTVIDAGPPPSTAKGTVTASFYGDGTGSPIAEFQCQLDGVGWASCTSPVEVSADEGFHGLEIRAVDEAGNVELEPATVFWTRDTTPPDTSIYAGPTGATKDRSPIFVFGTTESGGGYECRLDDGSWEPCDAGWIRYTDLAPGGHVFAVRALDAAGNVDPSQADVTWTIDTCVPETTIDAGPPAVTGSTEASFDFGTGHAPPITYRCQLDDEAYADCAPGQLFAGLSPGAHEFRVKAIDDAGNADETPAVYAWRIDTSPAVDATIRATGDAVWLGDGVINDTGLGQTRLLKVKPGATAEFEIEVLNEALVYGSIVVKGPGNASGVKVTYLDAGTVVTSQVVAGYDVGNLSPTASEVITLRVKLAKTATGTRSFLITASAGADATVHDAVLAKIKAKA